MFGTVTTSTTRHRLRRWTMGSPSDETLILPLDSPDASLERVGGKGASLARLAQAGLTVPTGFHITTRVYRRFVGENQLSERIVSAAAESKADDPSTLAQASTHIQALIAQGQVPHEMAASIRQAYGALGGGGEGVPGRSSATAGGPSAPSVAG